MTILRNSALLLISFLLIDVGSCVKVDPSRWTVAAGAESFGPVLGEFPQGQNYTVTTSLAIGASISIFQGREGILFFDVAIPASAIGKDLFITVHAGEEKASAKVGTVVPAPVVTAEPKAAIPSNALALKLTGSHFYSYQRVNPGVSVTLNSTVGAPSVTIQSVRNSSIELAFFVVDLSGIPRGTVLNAQVRVNGVVTPEVPIGVISLPQPDKTSTVSCNGQPGPHDAPAHLPTAFDCEIACRASGAATEGGSLEDFSISILAGDITSKTMAKGSVKFSVSMWSNITDVVRAPPPWPLVRVDLPLRQEEIADGPFWGVLHDSETTGPPTGGDGDGKNGFPYGWVLGVSGALLAVVLVVCLAKWRTGNARGYRSF